MGTTIRDEVARLLGKRGPSFRNRLQDLGQDLHDAARRVRLAGNESEPPGEGNDRDSRIDPLASALFSFENGVEDLLRWLGAPLPPDPGWWEHAEEHYRSLGKWKWKGPGASEPFRNAVRQFWRRGEESGARWLVERLRNESNLDTLHGAATVLAALPTFSQGPILDALRSDPTPDQALALLQALSWIAEDRSGLTFPFVGDGEDVEVVLAEYLQHDDPDLREAASRAMRLLPSERMVRWLKGRLRIEPDADVRQTLTEELSRLQPLDESREALEGMTLKRPRPAVASAMWDDDGGWVRPRRRGRP